MRLSDKKLRVLSILSDTIVPRVQELSSHTSLQSDDGFYARSASDLGADSALVDFIETRFEPSLREKFCRLLDIFDNKCYNFILTGRPVRFSDLQTVGQRTKYLAGWRDSRIASKRQAFQALKILTCFLFYTVTSNDGSNPNWPAIGYSGPNRSSNLRHPEDLRIRPLQIENDLKFDCDVCVVGSGAGGSIVAYELSKAGFDVVVVESGDYETSETFSRSELSVMKKLFDGHGSAAATSDLSVILLSGRGAGGGTTINCTTSIKPPLEVLLEWENTFGISGLTGAEFQSHIDDIWNGLKVNLSESQKNGNNDVLWKGCTSLGYREGLDYKTIWRNAVGCRGRCAFCTSGCVYSCKQSTLLNYLPMAFKNGAKFLFNTEIEHIIVESGVAKGVEGRLTTLSTGKHFQVEIGAKVVVLACGSIKTPALLLRSGIRNKNIGRNLRLHPTTTVLGHFKEKIRAWDGPPQTVVVTKFLDSDGPLHGFWIEAAPTHPGFFALSAPWCDGQSHKEYMKTWFNHSSSSVILLKEWGSGNVIIDKHGSANVSYKLQERDRKNMVKGMKETARILVAAGAIGLSSLHTNGLEVISADDNPLTQGELNRFSESIEREGIVPNKIMLFSAHLMGSCRMSSTESLGAVDPKGELYGVRNLFVADASVFPTALGVNPMITIMSMAKRTSDFVKRKMSAE